MKTIANETYRASAMMAKEKGAFPMFCPDQYLKGKFIGKLDEDVQELIRTHGTRNSHLLSIAPTGTISLTADNISSGVEPPFMLEFERTMKTFEGDIKVIVQDYAYREWGIEGKTADECTVQEHLDVLVAASKWVDSAVSKTLNVGDKVTWEEFQDIYMQAWRRGVKGCTTFRAAGKRFGILNAVKEEDLPEGGACYINQETGVRTCDE